MKSSKNALAKNALVKDARKNRESPGMPDLPQNWWAIPGEQLAGFFGISPETGLDLDKISSMQAKYGVNLLQGQGPSSLARLLWQSIKSPMMILLLAIAGISLALRQVREAIVMVFVVAMYVSIELINKARSDRTMARLRALQMPTATVFRESRQQTIPVGELCVGDLLVVQTGTRIPADARLISSTGLLVNEGSLTGESAPQTKDATAIVPPEAPLAERPTAIFSGTTVLDGQGIGMVMAVGLKSELGRISALSASSVSTSTPLQKEMLDLARTLAFVAIGVSCLIPLIGWFRGYDLQQMLLTWLSLTFLMVPGQPPVIITMALALAAFELTQKQVIVRRLQGAETLGSVNTIVSDKTGTMTENVMAFDRLILGNGHMLATNQVDTSQMPIWLDFFAKALPAIPKSTNNPIDLAVLSMARELRISSQYAGRIIHQVGFATGKFYRSLTYEQANENQLFLAGSPEFIIGQCAQTMVGGQQSDWDEEGRNRVLSAVQRLASEGKRITAYAFRTLPVASDLPDELIFVGCAVFADPIRPEVKVAIAQMATARHPDHHGHRRQCGNRCFCRQIGRPGCGYGCNR